MFLVDTNILLYAAERRFREHARCREMLLTWRKQPTAWYTTWGILYEFMRVATHPRVFSRPWTARNAWGFVLALLEAPALRVLTETDQHAQVVEQVFQELPLTSGNLIHDAHTAVLMREHGLRVIYTRDTDFHRFPFLEVRDPLSSP